MDIIYKEQKMEHTWNKKYATFRYDTGEVENSFKFITMLLAYGLILQYHIVTKFLHASPLV